MYLNLFAMIGTVKTSPQMYSTPRGSMCTKFDIEYIKWKGERPQYFKCIAWDIVAKNSNLLLRPGMLISISGTLEQNTWTNKQNITIDEIVLKVFQFEILDNINQPSIQPNSTEGISNNYNENIKVKDSEFPPNEENEERMRKIPNITQQSDVKYKTYTDDDIPF